MLDAWAGICTTGPSSWTYSNVWEGIRKMKEIVGEWSPRPLVLLVSELACDKVWEFPKDRFIEYEPKDEGWCRRLGFGREVIAPKAYILKGGIDPITGWGSPDQLICHPLLADRIKSAMRESVHPFSAQGILDSTRHV